MLRRIFLLTTVVAALGVGLALANVAVQKDKVKTESTEKQKQGEASLGAFGVDFGGGGYLGVYLEEVSPDRAKELGLQEERGAIVMKVVSGSPAEKAGLKENDVIVSFNGRRVDSVRELQRLLSETPPERTVQIESIRGGARQTVAATLSKRSFQNFSVAWPQIDDKAMKQAEEALKRSEEELKRSQEKWKESENKLRDLPNFGDFAFVNPGELSLFGAVRLGISAESLTDQLAQFFGVADGKGVLVSSVSDDGAAAKAGLKAGDVIIGVDNQKIDGVHSLLTALSAKSEGTVTLKIVRNHAEQTVTVTLEKREPLTPRRRAVALHRYLRIV